MKIDLTISALLKIKHYLEKIKYKAYMR